MTSNRIVTFGEIMMRITPLGYKKLSQSNQLEYYFGGTEANVAISLRQLGNSTRFVSSISNDFIADAVLKYLNQFQVDTQFISQSDHPLGIYFLEVGAVMRPSVISYNRMHSAFCQLNPEDFDWEAIFEDCNWFHWTGITPALSNNAYECLKMALEVANRKGVTVSADPAYRSGLWKYGKDSQKVLKELVERSDIFIGGPNEINHIFNKTFDNDKAGFEKASTYAMSQCTSISKVVDKTRVSKNANWHSLKGRMLTENDYLETEEIEITHIIDRIGTGDAFAAGLIHGLLYFSDQKALDFANAACALKHTVEGDANLVDEETILSLLQGENQGRLKR